MEQFFMEKAVVKVVTGPIDLNDGANNGARVDLSKGKRVTFIVAAAAGTAPSSHTISFQQHDAATAGNSAALSISNPYYHRLDTAAEFTKVVPGAAASSFDVDTLVADAKFVVVFEVLVEDLTDGYRWVSLNMTDSGGAQLGAVVAVVHECDEKPAYLNVI